MLFVKSLAFIALSSNFAAALMVIDLPQSYTKFCTDYPSTWGQYCGAYGAKYNYYSIDYTCQWSNSAGGDTTHVMVGCTLGDAAAEADGTAVDATPAVVSGQKYTVAE